MADAISFEKKSGFTASITPLTWKQSLTNRLNRA